MKEDLIKYLNNKQIPEDIELKNKIKDFKNFFNNFFHKFTPGKLYELAKISDKDLILASIIICNTLNTNEVLKLIEKYPNLIPDDNYSPIFSVLCIYFNEQTIKNDIDNYLKNKFAQKFKLLNIFIKTGIPGFVNSGFISFIKNNPKSLEELEPIFKNLSMKDNELCVNVITAKREFNQLVMREFSSSINYENRKFLKKSVIPEEAESKNLINAANAYFEHINLLYNKIIRDYEQQVKERRQHNKNINDLIKLLDTEDEIKNIDFILKLCPDTEIANLVVNYVINHNKEIYNNLIITYKKTKMNNDENLEILFNRYGFIYETLKKSEKDKLKKMSYEDIEDLLIRLNSLSLYNINIVEINVSNLKNIEELISKNLITKDWLKLNVELLYENSELELVNSNIDLLTNKNINIMLYTNSLDIIKSKQLKQNLELFDFYNLTINKSTTDINFLSIHNLRTKIEFLISIGLFQELENLDILNYSLIDYHKLKISNILNIPITMIDINEEDLINDYANIIIPSFINKILNNETNFISDLPISLGKYQIDKYTLNIDGVLVSIEKIKRNIAKLENTNNESCFYAIIHDGYYTYEEIEKLAYSLELEKDFYNLCIKKLSL